MSEKGLETCLSKPLFLYGAECVERLEVARRFHEHGFFADGAFVEARLSAVPRALREGALFGPVVDCFSHSGVWGKTCWLSQAQGGTLLVDELDCLCSALQQRFMEWLKEEYYTGRVPRLRVILASQYEPALLVHSGGLTPEFSAWIQALDTGQCLGPERIRAVQNFSAGNGVPGLAGLAAVLEPVMRSYVEAGLEAGGHGLYATIIGEVERPLITMALRHTGGNQIRASALLGVNRNTLRKRIRELQIILPTKREML